MFDRQNVPPCVRLSIQIPFRWCLAVGICTILDCLGVITVRSQRSCAVWFSFGCMIRVRTLSQGNLDGCSWEDPLPNFCSVGHFGDEGYFNHRRAQPRHHARRLDLARKLIVSQLPQSVHRHGVRVIFGNVMGWDLISASRALRTSRASRALRWTRSVLAFHLAASSTALGPMRLLISADRPTLAGLASIWRSTARHRPTSRPRPASRHQRAKGGFLLLRTLHWDLPGLRL